MAEMTVCDCYKIMKIGKVINIEDDLKFDSSVKAIVYDYLHLNDSCRKQVERALNDSEIAGILRQLYDAMPLQYSWVNTPDRNAEMLLKSDDIFKEALTFFETLVKKGISETDKKVFRKYGVGIKKDTAVLPELLIPERNSGRVPLRIIEDWNADDIRFFDEEISKSIETNERFICIIDDQLHNEKCGEKIIEHIKEMMETVSDVGTYIVLSSNGNSNLAKFDEKIYIDYVQKDSDKKALFKTAMNAIARSNYHMLLRILLKKKHESLECVCHEAFNNKDTAIYLANMANDEGVTGYSVIDDWINLCDKYYFEKTFGDDIKTMTSLSWILSMTKDMSFETKRNWEDITQLQDFEQFDYSVNDRLMSIQPGDVFEITKSGENRYYVLIGQPCDMMLRHKRGGAYRKKDECILLPAVLDSDQYVPKTMHTASEGKVVVNNLRICEKRYSLHIDTQDEELIDDMILDLCSYNTQGRASVNLRKELSTYEKSLISDPMAERFLQIVSFFSSYVENVGTSEIIKTIIEKFAPAEKSRIVPIYDFERREQEISFEVERICRIKKYATLLNQLHSEYETRLGFDTMNVDCVECSVGKVCIQTLENPKTIENVYFQLTTDRNKNREDRRKLRWFIKKASLDSILEDALIDKSLFNKLIIDDYYVFDNASGMIEKGMKYTKMYKREDRIHTLIIESM